MMICSAIVAWFFLTNAIYSARAGEVSITMIDAGIALACLVYLGTRWEQRYNKET